MVGAGICSKGETLATSGGFPGKRANVVQTPIAAIPAMMPVKAVSDNFDERFSGSIERMLAKTAVHLMCSLPKKLGVVLAPDSRSGESGGCDILFLSSLRHELINAQLK
jgi:hypothetical protein